MGERRMRGTRRAVPADGAYSSSSSAVAFLPHRRWCLVFGGPWLLRLAKDVLQNAWLDDPLRLWKTVPRRLPEAA